MDFTDFTAGKNDNDRRIDKILRFFLEDASLSEIYKLIRKGLIKVNKKKCKPETHVFEGDTISIAAFLLSKTNKVPSSEISCDDTTSTHLNIIFENEIKHIIHWDEKEARFKAQISQNFEGGFIDCGIGFDWVCYKEVIGNIHENKEVK